MLFLVCKKNETYQNKITIIYNNNEFALSYVDRKDTLDHSILYSIEVLQIIQNYLENIKDENNFHDKYLEIIGTLGLMQFKIPIIILYYWCQSLQNAFNNQQKNIKNSNSSNNMFLNRKLHNILITN